MLQNESDSFDIIQLPERPADWDREIRKFATKTLFHESAWLDFMMLKVPHQHGVKYFEIRQGGTLVGYFCGLVLKKFVFSMYESLWLGTTVYQGPVVNLDVNQAELVRALMRVSKQNGIASMKLTNEWLDPSVMRQLGFAVTPSVTQVCPLKPDEAAVWNAMKGTCRTRIRKGERMGLVAEETQNPVIADYFYRFFFKVLALKGRLPPYDVNFPRTLMACLLPADLLFPIWVKYQGKVIGAAFYAHDDRAMYYLDGASDPAYLHLCPNELLHWTAMKLAIRRGIPVFNIGGAPAPSRFTRKFGGGLVPFNTYHKSFVPFLEAARQLYALRHAV